MSSVNVEVTPKYGESQDRMIRRFFKKCKKARILEEHIEKTMFFRTKADKARAKRIKNKKLKEKLSRQKYRY